MITDQLKMISRRRPFQAFRVVLKSGESLHINSPHRAVVAEPMAVFGVDEDPQTHIARKMRIVNVGDIVAVELLQNAK